MMPTRYRPLTDQLTDSLFVYQCVDAARLAADRPTAFKAVAAILRAYQDEARMAWNDGNEPPPATPDSARVRRKWPKPRGSRSPTSLCNRKTGAG